MKLVKIMIITLLSTNLLAQKNYGIVNDENLANNLASYIFKSNVEDIKNIKIIEREKFDEMKKILNLLDDSKEFNLKGADYLINYDKLNYLTSTNDIYVDIPKDTIKKLPARKEYSKTDCDCKLSINIKKTDTKTGLSSYYPVNFYNYISLSNKPNYMEKYNGLFLCKKKLIDNILYNSKYYLNKIIETEYAILDIIKIKGDKAKSVIINGGDYDGIDKHIDFNVFKIITEDVGGEKLDRLIKIGVLDLKNVKSQVTYCDVDEGNEEILKLFNEKVPLIVKQIKK